MAEMVDDGVNGRLFEPGSADDLARVLAELVDDPHALATLAGTTQQPRTVADDVAHLESLYATLAGPER